MSTKYEVKIKMVKEQLLLPTMKFLLVYNRKIVIQWRELTFGEGNKNLVGGGECTGGIFPGGMEFFQVFPPIPPVGKTQQLMQMKQLITAQNIPSRAVLFQVSYSQQGSTKQMFLEEKNVKNYFFSLTPQKFCLDLAKVRRKQNRKKLLFLPDRCCYHESNVNNSQVNSSFKAWNYVQKIYVWVFPSVLKRSEKMT